MSQELLGDKKKEQEQTTTIVIDWMGSKLVISNFIFLAFKHEIQVDPSFLGDKERIVGDKITSLIYDLGHNGRNLSDFPSSISLQIPQPAEILNLYTGINDLHIQTTFSQFFGQILIHINQYLTDVFSVSETAQQIGADYYQDRVGALRALINHGAEKSVVINCVTHDGQKYKIELIEAEGYRSDDVYDVYKDYRPKPIDGAWERLKRKLERQWLQLKQKMVGRKKVETKPLSIPSETTDPRIPILVSERQSVNTEFQKIAKALLKNPKLFQTLDSIRASGLGSNLSSVSYEIHRDSPRGYDFWLADDDKNEQINSPNNIAWKLSHPEIESFDFAIAKSKLGRLPSVLSIHPRREEIVRLFTPEVVTSVYISKVLPHISRLLTHDDAPWCEDFAIETINNYQLWPHIPFGEKFGGVATFVFWTYGPFVLAEIKKSGGTYYDFMTKWVMKRRDIGPDSSRPYPSEAENSCYPGIEFMYDYYCTRKHYLGRDGRYASHVFVDFITRFAVMPTLEEPPADSIAVGTDLTRFYEKTLVEWLKQHQGWGRDGDAEQYRIWQDVTSYLTVLSQAKRGRVIIKSAVIGQRFVVDTVDS